MEPLRNEERRVPGERAAPVVADDVGARLALFAGEEADEALEVAEQRLDPVGAYAARLLGQVVPAQVGRDGAEARGGERRDLVPPRVPEFGKAVQEDDERALALLHPVEPDAVHAALAMGPGLRHAPARSGSFTRVKSAAERSPSASIVSHRSASAAVLEESRPERPAQDEREAERHRVQAHVGAALVRRRRVRDPGGHRRDEDHLAEGPHDDGRDDRGQRPRPRERPEPGRDEDGAQDEGSAVRPVGHREVERDLEEDDQERVHRVQEAEDPDGEADVAHEEDGHRGLVLEEDDADGHERHEEEHDCRVAAGPPGGTQRRRSRARRPAARFIGKKKIRVAAARSEVTPSTMKSAGHDTAARKPPAAGPTLIPRLTASRWRAKAALRWSGAARCETTLRLAGRNISPVRAMRRVSSRNRRHPAREGDEEKEGARGDERDAHQPHGSDPVRQASRDRRDGERSRAEEGEDEARGAGREAPLARQVEDEKRQEHRPRTGSRATPPPAPTARGGGRRGPATGSTGASGERRHRKSIRAPGGSSRPAPAWIMGLCTSS